MRTKNDARIAVIGAGISGLSAAWLMSRHRDVTLYEAADRLGGHANTVLAPAGDGAVASRHRFHRLQRPQLSQSRCAVRSPARADLPFRHVLFRVDRRRRLRILRHGINGLLAQTSNAAKPRFWRMLRDIARFYREAPGLLARSDLQSVTLGRVSRTRRLFAEFRRRSSAADGCCDLVDDGGRYARLPAACLHPLLRAPRPASTCGAAPKWRTVQGGSRNT